MRDQIWILNNSKELSVLGITELFFTAFDIMDRCFFDESGTRKYYLFCILCSKIVLIVAH